MAKIFLFTLLLAFTSKASTLFDASNTPFLQKEVQEYKIKELLRDHYILDIYKDYTPLDININEELTSSERKLLEDTVYIQVFMVGTIAALYMMPESVSKWDKDALKEQSLSSKWKEHVKAGPVWDEDDFFINYVGHPVSGAWYYMVAREDGISKEGSFLYSVMLSTFFWEYGYEAFAEIPSWQDLFSTPIIGSLMGEWFYSIKKDIDKNGGKVFGSQTLGGVSYFLLNPIGNISHGLSEFFDLHVTLKYQTYHPYYSLQREEMFITQERLHVVENQDVGFVLDIEF